ncbi:hypothetical protein EKO04_010123 [Ascochyta lentis]|uniref:Uncharacterized protein n=1 Tax=Ascochyta lentis TaxID=205686 RepID=A0A8H7IUP6_9PLEO|nr:hypothetical protein EKO04_010123 [Ascochyta lentis]
MSPKPPKTLTAVLRLSPKHLAQFPHDAPAPPSPASKPASTPEASPAPHMADLAAADASADTPDTPAAPNGASTPSSLAPPASAPGSKRKTPAPKAGIKRSAAAIEGSSTPKPRGKPGPKKRKLGDMVNDPNTKTPLAASTPMQKLGPKANQGAINAGLRALDRTGKFKCRKWEKRGFQLRSFTGVAWDVPSWKAPNRNAAFLEDVKSDSTGSSDTKVKDESSAVSEKSGLNGDGATPVPPLMEGLNSSPAPVPAV